MNSNYYSQAGQDRWVNELFKGKRNGFFLDIGAYDGIATSNTFFFEKVLGWNGICVEANKNVYNSLCLNRKSINVFGAITDYNGTCGFSGFTISEDSEKVPCFTLESVLNKYSAPNEIDYLSLDIEGAEYKALSTLDFERWSIKTLTVEHNLYCEGPKNKNRIFNLLSSKGFIRAVEDAPCLDKSPNVYMKPFEDWYINSKYVYLWKQ